MAENGVMEAEMNKGKIIGSEANKDIGLGDWWTFHFLTEVTKTSSKNYDGEIVWQVLYLHIKIIWEIQSGLADWVIFYNFNRDFYHFGIRESQDGRYYLW